MTPAGFKVRRSYIILAYDITALQGKPLVKVDKKPDSKDLAMKKRDVLSKLSPSVTSRMAQIHGVLTIAINAIVQDPDTHLKNS